MNSSDFTINEKSEYEPVRINRFLSEAGFCSRREADRLIAEGIVTVDGKQAVPGMKVSFGQNVEVSGQIVEKETQRVLLAYNKPAGVECTADRSNPDNIIDRIGYPLRIYPAGRLDKDSTGLIFLTNIGSLMNSILKTQGAHEKEYQVRVDGEVTDSFLENIRSGVDISGNDGRRFLKDEEIVKAPGKEFRYKTLPCRAYRTGQDSFNIILIQGLNRQIRRMCLALGRRVTGLRRIRIMNITLGDLREGEYREIKGAELEELERMLREE